MSDSIDDLLAQLNSSPIDRTPNPTQPQGPIQKPAVQKSAANKSIDDLLQDVEQRSDQPSSAPSQNSAPFQPQSLPIKTTDQSTDRLLADLKSTYAEQDRIEQQAQQERLRAEQHRRAALKQQQQRAIVQQAEAWLKTLNQQSSEAAWFEEFAAKYKSRVEAAIDYLGLKR